MGPGPDGRRGETFPFQVFTKAAMKFAKVLAAKKRETNSTIKTRDRIS